MADLAAAEEASKAEEVAGATPAVVVAETIHLGAAVAVLTTQELINHHQLQGFLMDQSIFSRPIIFIRLNQPIQVIQKSFLFNSMNTSLLQVALGKEYRFATFEEVTKAHEAATPGGVNNWTATNQVKPRNLPGNINEYGFDVSTTDGLWVIKE